MENGAAIGYIYPDGTPMRVGDVVEFEEASGGRFGIVNGCAVPGRVDVAHSARHTGSHAPTSLRLVQAFPFRPGRLDLPAGHPDAVPAEVYQAVLARLQPVGPRVRHERRVVFEGTPERVAKQIALSADVPFRMPFRDLLVTVEFIQESPCPS